MNEKELLRFFDKLDERFDKSDLKLDSITEEIIKVKKDVEYLKKDGVLINKNLDEKIKASESKLDEKIKTSESKLKAAFYKTGAVLMGSIIVNYGYDLFRKFVLKN